MTNDPIEFAIGRHRPVYLWAGPGTVRMNRLKFMDAPVDEAVHEEAHTLTGAVRMAREAHFNWAYLMYDWGFPPEVESEDWEAFERAVPVFHSAGLRVFGYVQSSNCARMGSYRHKDWYAVGPRGRPFPYYTGRYMTCWRHPEWWEHLREMVRGVVEAEADGVFFDNPWYALQPLHGGGAWLGPAGCYCERCRGAFREEVGEEIPVEVTPESDELSRRYLRWRADQVTGALGELAEYARSLNPKVYVSANDFDAVMRPSLTTYGIDLEGLAEVQDVMMIEDFGLPKWQPPDGEGPGALTNNAITVHTARALIGDTPLSVNPYDAGIGFDEVYPPRRFRQAIAEAAACGASTVVKGTEYVEADGTFTLLTAQAYAPQREAIGEVNRWLSENAQLYADRRPAAPIAILHPGDALWQRWDALAPTYFAVGQALLLAGLPWRVVTRDDLEGVEELLLVTPPPSELKLPEGVRAVNVSALSEWKPPAPSYLARHPVARSFAGALVRRLFDAYFSSRFVRNLMDRAGLPQRLFIRSPHFTLPSQERQSSLAEVLEVDRPRVVSPYPVLVTAWKRDGARQLHLVNYADAPQAITVSLEGSVEGHLLSPSAATRPFSGRRLDTELDVYAVLVYR